MRIHLLSIALFSSAVAFCQPHVKLYGYSQEFTPGMVRERDLSDSAANLARPSVTYYLYFTAPASSQIRPAGLWINGKQIEMKSAPVVKSPVVRFDRYVLVPGTRAVVREIQWADSLPATRTAPWLRKMIRENELVMTYFWNGKKYGVALKKIKALEVVFGE